MFPRWSSVICTALLLVLWSSAGMPQGPFYAAGHVLHDDIGIAGDVFAQMIKTSTPQVRSVAQMTESR
ncbi:MAG: hypothetical protein ACREQ7_23355 [Candidatus Binatia bacterium]